jgi:hypothetical protein
VRADDRPLTIADLAGYREALDGKPGGEPASVGFRDLWAQADRYRGKRVRVEGHVARIFHQPSVGRFPPLAEVWAVSPAGDPLCLVFAEKPGTPAPHMGDEIGFVGTFLRLIPYEGSDAKRLAPLIVGDKPPAPPPRPRQGTEGPGRSAIDWLVGPALGMIVVALLLARHLRRPVSPLQDLERLEPPPQFVDDAASNNSASVTDPDASSSGGP